MQLETPQFVDHNPSETIEFSAPTLSAFLDYMIYIYILCIYIYNAHLLHLFGSDMGHVYVMETPAARLSFLTSGPSTMELRQL